MRAAVELAAEQRGKGGATVVEIDDPRHSPRRANHLALQNFEAAMALAFEYEHHRDG